MQMTDLIPDLTPTILAARALRDDLNTLEPYFPVENVNSNSYRLGQRARLDQAAPVRAIDAPATPIVRPGVTTVRGDLPAISPIVDLSEGDLIDDMRLANALNGADTPQSRIDSAAAMVTATINNTLELMRGQVISTGTVSLLAEDGVIHDVDFGLQAEQKIASAEKWTPANALTNLIAAATVAGDVSGNDPGVILTTRKIKRVLVAALNELYKDRPATPADLTSWLAANDLPDIQTNDRQFVGQGKQRVIPEGTVAFIGSANSPLGATELGITQEAIKQVNRLQPNGAPALTASTAAGITIVTLAGDNPVREAVQGAAIGMPILRDPTQLTVVSGAA